MKSNVVKFTSFVLVVTFICLGFTRDTLSSSKRINEGKEGSASSLTAVKTEIPDSLLPVVYQAHVVSINPPFLGKSFTGFKEALGYKESRGNYYVTNQFGYLGKYQFGRGTLRAFGIHDTASFLNDPILQEKVFLAFMSRNKAILKKEIQRYVGKTIGGVQVTESGILAAAHLGGAGNVKKFLKSGGKSIFRDGNGTSIKFYLKKFAGYDVSFIKANRKARLKTGH